MSPPPARSTSGPLAPPRHFLPSSSFHFPLVVQSRPFPCRYLDNQAFVSLANGELVAYQREAGTAFDCEVM